MTIIHESISPLPEPHHNENMRHLLALSPEGQKSIIAMLRARQLGHPAIIEAMGEVQQRNHDTGTPNTFEDVEELLLNYVNNPEY